MVTIFLASVTILWFEGLCLQLLHHDRLIRVLLISQGISIFLPGKLCVFYMPKQFT